MVEVIRERTELFGSRSAHQDVLVERVSLGQRKSKQREHEHRDQPRDSDDPHAWRNGGCGMPPTRRSDIRSGGRI